MEANNESYSTDATYVIAQQLLLSNELILMKLKNLEDRISKLECKLGIINNLDLKPNFSETWGVL